jgi:hypothetical protein
MAEKLQIENQNEPIIGLLAIISSEPIYRLSWLLNQQLGISLSEGKSLNVLHLKRHEIQSFNIFECVVEEEEFHYFLIQNKGQQGPFDEENKQVDYWLRIEGDNPSIPEIFKKVKLIKEINLVFEVKPGSLKPKSRLLLPIRGEN